MIGRIPYPVALYEDLDKPAVAAAVTWSEYLHALEDIASTAKEKVSLGVWGRWLTTTHRSGDAIAVFNEKVADDFTHALASGALCRENGKPYRRDIVKQASSCMRALHNRLYEKDPAKAIRRLLPQHVANRLAAFARLTGKTRTALSWFEQHGMTQGRGPRKSPKHLLTATRTAGVYDAIQFLKQLGKNGLEEVRKEDVPDLSLEAVDFKRHVRLRHSVQIVYRACVLRGLLEHNPLEGTSTASFNNEALRDFLPPDEFARVRDLSTLDRGNPRLVAERLIMMIYLDLALRKNELAGVQVEDVRQLAPGKIQIHLAGEVQKMGNKSTVDMDVLYPETAQLLGLHLRNRGREPGTLFLTPRGNQSTGEYLYKCVKREASRLKLRTYHGRTPSCHDLRRTFATCNSGSLGLKFDPYEIAQRLRCSIDVAFKHYVQENPLLRSMRADEHRRQLMSDPFTDANTHLDALRSLGISADALEAARGEAHRRFAPPASPATAIWMPEAEVLSKLTARWDVDVSHRTLRPYFRSLGALDHGGTRGAARYRQDVVEELMQHEPLDNLAGTVTSRRRRGAIAKEFPTIRLGSMVLVRSTDAARVLRSLRLANGVSSVDVCAGVSAGVHGGSDGSNLTPCKLRQCGRANSVRVASEAASEAG